MWRSTVIEGFALALLPAGQNKTRDRKTAAFLFFFSLDFQLIG
jgi:hypothetical protein